MKTVMIYDTLGQDALQFLVFEGDWSHLNGIYVNHVNCDRAKQQELCDMLYDSKTGDMLYEDKIQPSFPTEEVKAGAVVIVCGFLP